MFLAHPIMLYYNSYTFVFWWYYYAVFVRLSLILFALVRLHCNKWLVKLYHRERIIGAKNSLVSSFWKIKIKFEILIFRHAWRPWSLSTLTSRKTRSTRSLSRGCSTVIRGRSPSRLHRAQAESQPRRRVSTNPKTTIRYDAKFSRLECFVYPKIFFV